MKYALEEITPVKKTLSVEIPLEVVSKEISDAYSQLSKTVRLPGFRKGKAPMALLEKKFYEEVKDDVLKKLIPDYYHKAVEESGIEPIEYPKIENIALEKMRPFLLKPPLKSVPNLNCKITPVFRSELKN